MTLKVGLINYNLFSPQSELDGDTLYMDLDVVIMKNIDDMATIWESKNFVGMNDFNPSSGFQF